MKQSLFVTMAMLLTIGLVVWCLLGAGPAPQNGPLQFCGQTMLDWPGRSTTADARYEYRVDRDSFQGTLTITPADRDASFHPFQFKPEIGQQFLTAAYPAHFGRLGNLICTEWGFGASSRKLTVYRLTNGGQIEPVFDETCRFGFRILDVEGDATPEICGGYGRLDGPKQMKVFGWDGARFHLVKTVPVTEPHTYLIQTGASKDRDK